MANRLLSSGDNFIYLTPLEVDILKNCSTEDYYITCNGRKINEDEPAQTGEIYHVVPRLIGGKGGFGSMLRALGAQIEKTTNREACRDLSGRRMRDVNNEKNLREWVQRKSQLEKEHEEKKQERAKRRRELLEQGPAHQFQGEGFFEERAQIQEELEQALQQGLSQASTSKKRKVESEEAGPSKAAAHEWLGVELDSSDEEDQSSSVDDVSECSMRVLANSSCANLQSLDKTDFMSVNEAEEVKACSSSSSSAEDCRHNNATSTNHERGDSSQAETVKSEDSGVQTKDEVMDAETGATAGDASVSSGSQPQTSPTEEEQHTELDAFDLESAESVSAVEALGLDRLKAELQKRGLKCGGSLKERAQRLWSVRGIDPSQWDKKLLAKKT